MAQNEECCFNSRKKTWAMTTHFKGSQMKLDNLLVVLSLSLSVTSQILHSVSCDCPSSYERTPVEWVNTLREFTENYRDNQTETTQDETMDIDDVIIPIASFMLSQMRNDFDAWTTSFICIKLKENLLILSPNSKISQLNHRWIWCIPSKRKL